MKYEFTIEDFTVDLKHFDIFKDIFIEQAYDRWKWCFIHINMPEIKANGYDVHLLTLEEFEQYFIMYNIPYRKHIEPKIEYKDIPKLEPLIL